MLHQSRNDAEAEGSVPFAVEQKKCLSIQNDTRN
jgi:hypothetical protein